VLACVIGYVVIPLPLWKPIPSDKPGRWGQVEDLLATLMYGACIAPVLPFVIRGDAPDFSPTTTLCLQSSRSWFTPA
jgi:hypothetical protein